MQSVQETLARAGIFQGVDPDAVINLISQMQTESFPAAQPSSTKANPAIPSTSSSKAK